jgi:hypothetical protein
MTLRMIRFTILSVLRKPLRDFIRARVRRTVQNAVSLDDAETVERRCTRNDTLANSLQSMPGNGYGVLLAGKCLSEEIGTSGIFLASTRL